LREEIPLSHELKAVLLHSGNAEGGHDTFLVFINGTWIEFNDNKVSELPEIQFAERCFGKDPNPSIDKHFNPRIPAYLLFSMKTDGTSKINDEVWPRPGM
jgi:hypothetical protein